MVFMEMAPHYCEILQREKQNVSASGVQTDIVASRACLHMHVRVYHACFLQVHENENHTFTVTPLPALLLRLPVEGRVGNRFTLA